MPARAGVGIVNVFASWPLRRKRTVSVPSVIGLKFFMLLRWMAQFPVFWPASRFGYSRNSSVESFHWVTTTAGISSSPSAAGASLPHAATETSAAAAIIHIHDLFVIIDPFLRSE